MGEHPRPAAVCPECGHGNKHDSYREPHNVPPACTNHETGAEECDCSRDTYMTALKCQRDLQSANERIQALTKEVDEVREQAYTVWARERLALRVDEYRQRTWAVESQLSALQRAAREYRFAHPCDNEANPCQADQALIDLLK